MTEKLTLSVDEAAKCLGIGRNLCYNLCRQGKIPCLALGQKRLRVPKVAIERLLQGNAQINN